MHIEVHHTWLYLGFRIPVTMETVDTAKQGKIVRCIKAQWFSPTIYAVHDAMWTGTCRNSATRDTTVNCDTGTFHPQC